ncbi:MAG TPA: ATPase, T2SS/T4P/T4SS family [Candidatus Omnitrophota bacterium]|nr:Flp pilus assembly complex ATPase component TadA [Candidatus Omnitrophota bacterium]HQO57109.1 ATPase, T2SS/T4P/T4SS family [Candidatus Omnitrophota bacterium]HQP11609.1 ATPase, T2SS/T4P/T4SS family [Candidatus Omnitrophota bacterium]
MFSLKERLQQILLRDNIIKQEDLDRALLEQKNSGGDLSQVLVRMNLISEDDLTHILSEGLGLPPIDISRLKIDPSVVKLIPRDVAQKYQIMPVSKMGGNLTLAMADPLNIFVIDDVKALTGLSITPIIARSTQLADAIERCYTQGTPAESGETLESIIKDMRDAEELELVKEQDLDSEKVSVEDISQDAPLIKLTDTIIQQAVMAKASDVFIEPLEKTLRIRYRVDGVIREIDQMSKALHLAIISRLKVVSNLDISERRIPQDGRFRTILSGNKEVDFRVNVLPTIFGEKIVLRVLDKSAGAVDINNLGFQPEALRRLKECADKPHGMILSCGPTGSGKTTTLYSILKYIDSPGKNIVTVEDPVEYQMAGLNQVNVKPSVGLTFASTLRSILRQDPDVIMIGEIRESETLDIAVKAALTGHLVVSSLHTTTAAGSIVRMVNMGVEPFLICSSVIAVVGQRLLRRICPKCKEEFVLSPEMAEKVGLKAQGKKGDIRLSRGQGCKNCLKTGYSGRVGISEILVLTPPVRKGILQRAGELQIKMMGRREGMTTMREDAMAKALAGLTTLEEVLRVTAADESLEKTPAETPD